MELEFDILENKTHKELINLAKSKGIKIQSGKYIRNSELISNIRQMCNINVNNFAFNDNESNNESNNESELPCDSFSESELSTLKMLNFKICTESIFGEINENNIKIVIPILESGLNKDPTIVFVPSFILNDDIKIELIQMFRNFNRNANIYNYTNVAYWNENVVLSEDVILYSERYTKFHNFCMLLMRINSGVNLQNLQNLERGTRLGQFNIGFRRQVNLMLRF